MQELREEFDIDVRLLGVATSSRMALSDSGIDLSSWREELNRYEPYSLRCTLQKKRFSEKVSSG